MNALDDLGVPRWLGKPPYEYGSKPGKPHGEPQNFFGIAGCSSHENW